MARAPVRLSVAGRTARRDCAGAGRLAAHALRLGASDAAFTARTLGAVLAPDVPSYIPAMPEPARIRGVAGTIALRGLAPRTQGSTEELAAWPLALTHGVLRRAGRARARGARRPRPRGDPPRRRRRTDSCSAPAAAVRRPHRPVQPPRGPALRPPAGDRHRAAARRPTRRRRAAGGQPDRAPRPDLRPRRSTSAPATGPAGRVHARPGSSTSRWRSALSPCPEVRIDPLTGQRTIVAGARAGRPGGELERAAGAAHRRREDPFAEGHEDRTPPELYAVRPGGGGAGHARLVGAGRPQPVPGAERDVARARSAHANPRSVLGRRRRAERTR